MTQVMKCTSDKMFTFSYFHRVRKWLIKYNPIDRGKIPSLFSSNMSNLLNTSGITRIHRQGLKFIYMKV